MGRLCGFVAVVCVAIFFSGVWAGNDNGKGSSVARYTAAQSDKKVTVTAEGMNNSGGWSNILTAVPDANPPEFKFMQKKPSGPATQALRRFSVSATADAPEKLDHVFVTDIKGKHQVAVRQGP